MYKNKENFHAVLRGSVPKHAKAETTVLLVSQKHGQRHVSDAAVHEFVV
jgi:hypothetical protein